jgi:hypothetical protein
VHQRELKAMPGLHPARGGELLLGKVDADRPSAATRQPGRDVSGAAAQLQHIHAGDVRQRADLGLR